MASSNVMGYYTPSLPPVGGAALPPPPPPPPAPAPYPGYAPYPAAATTAGAGQTQIASWDTWTPTSGADPYVAGMRTSAAGLAALTGAEKVATYAKWSSMLKGRSKAGLSRASTTISKAGKSTASMKTYMSGKTFGSAKSAVKGPGVGGAISNTFFSFGNIARSMGNAAIMAVPVALLTNFLDWKAGKVTADQRNALIVADVAGYTVTGASASLVGGAIGTTFLGPLVGTAVGVAAGFGLGWAYEKYIRPKWGAWVHGAMYAGGTTPVVINPPIPEAK